MKPWWTVTVVWHELSDSSPWAAKTNLKEDCVILNPCPPPVLPDDSGTILLGCPGHRVCRWIFHIRAAVEVHFVPVHFVLWAQYIRHNASVAVSQG